VLIGFFAVCGWRWLWVIGYLQVPGGNDETLIRGQSVPPTAAYKTDHNGGWAQA